MSVEPSEARASTSGNGGRARRRWIVGGALAGGLALGLAWWARRRERPAASGSATVARVAARKPAPPEAAARSPS